MKNLGGRILVNLKGQMLDLQHKDGFKAELLFRR